jgi:uncharacterized membrane protein YidH (DUF202 family)
MASERTALAWGRTGLSLLVVAAGVMGVAIRHHVLVLGLASGPLLIALTVVLLWHSRRAYEERLATWAWPPDPVAIVAVAAMTIVGAVVAAIAGIIALV